MSLLRAKADKTSFNSSTVYGMDMDFIFYGKHRFWGLDYKQKQIKHHSTPVIVYEMGMDLICNWSLLNGKHGFWGLYYEQKQVKHHSTPVQYMELIWIWSVIDVYSIENLDSEVCITSKNR